MLKSKLKGKKDKQTKETFTAKHLSKKNRRRNEGFEQLKTPSMGKMEPDFFPQSPNGCSGLIWHHFKSILINSRLQTQYLLTLLEDFLHSYMGCSPFYIGFSPFHICFRLLYRSSFLYTFIHTLPTVQIFCSMFSNFFHFFSFVWSVLIFLI